MNSLLILVGAVISASMLLGGGAIPQVKADASTAGICVDGLQIPGCIGSGRVSDSNRIVSLSIGATVNFFFINELSDPATITIERLMKSDGTECTLSPSTLIVPPFAGLGKSAVILSFPTASSGTWSCADRSVSIDKIGNWELSGDFNPSQVSFTVDYTISESLAGTILLAASTLAVFGAFFALRKRAGRI